MRYIWILIFIICPSINLEAQTVAILDQGYNEELSYRGKSRFGSQTCFSYTDYKKLKFFGDFDHTWRVSLCPNGRSQQTIIFGAATHPRGNLLLWEQSAFPIPRFKTSKKLNHGRDVSNALYDFDRNTRQNLVQVYGFNANSKPLPTKFSSVTDRWNKTIIDTSRYNTNGGRFIVAALENLAKTAGSDLGAVVIATVIGNEFDTPSLCNGFGQQWVDLLTQKGVAVVAGLDNKDRLPNVRTWPNCLNGVINVGNTNTNFTKDGIGIGGNGIDFYTTSKTAVSGGFQYGNSLSAPKIASAFAILHKRHPGSSVSQKYQALERASASRHNYKGVKRRKITPSQMKNAAIELNKIIFPEGTFGDPDIDFSIGEVIAALPERFGPEHEGESTDVVKLNTNFGGVSSVLFSPSQTKSNLSDVWLQLTGIINSPMTSTRKFEVYVNGEKVTDVKDFKSSAEAVKTVGISRNLLRVGENQIEVRPIDSRYSWGLRNIKVARVPNIELGYGVLDPKRYGASFSKPSRPTNVKFEFDLSSPVDTLLSLNAYDINFSDEIRVLVNGKNLGFLSETNTGSFGPSESFSIRGSLLKSGKNTIELSQKAPDTVLNTAGEKRWAVENVKVTKSNPDIISHSFVISQRSIRSLEPFTVTAGFSNIGSGFASPSVVQFYLSSDELINPNIDSLVSTTSIGTLNSGVTMFRSSQIVTDKVNTGHFIGACYRPVPSETNKNNNCSNGIELKSDPGIAPIIMLLLDDESETASTP